MLEELSNIILILKEARVITAEVRTKGMFGLGKKTAFLNHFFLFIKSN